MAKTTLTISSKNYSSWSLRGWLLAKFSGLPFEEVVAAADDASARAEILLLSSSILVPCLRHQGATVWDTLAIAEYLNEVMPAGGLVPADRVPRAHCRSIYREIHSGFTTLRASLPVNLKGHLPGFKIWSRAQADIDRVWAIWRDCLEKSGGPFLFGENRTMAVGANPVGDLCRLPRRRAHLGRRHAARHRHHGARRDHDLRSARLHQDLGQLAARRRHRSPQRLFRRHVRADRAARRRHPEIHRLCPAR